MAETLDFETPAITGRDLSAIYSQLANQAHLNNLAFAMWQLPGQDEKHFIVDLSGTINRTSADLDELPEGFILSPFINPKLEQNVFIRADLHCYSGNTQIKTREGLSPDQSALVGEFQRSLDLGVTTTPIAWCNGQVMNFADTSRDAYLANVAAAVERIHGGDFQKVVLSKVKTTALSDRFDPIDTFFAICRTYKNAFVSLVSGPGLGTWLGASPESLISVNETSFGTSSVAGTQKIDPDVELPDVAWTQKEIEEQAIVSRYIINCFKKIRLREFEEIGPRTVKAANLIHLRTDYLVDLTAVNFPQLGTVMLELLHPTSAVCGMPQEAALNYILATEGFDRSYYSGFLGPVNVEGSTDIFVNLRCMQLQKNNAVLYSGAGITAESKPEKEWVETEIKCDTLLNLLNR